MRAALGLISVAGMFLLGYTVAARGADRMVHVQVPAPVKRNVAAMPLIAAPQDDAERRINTAVKRLDARVAKAVAGCHGAGRQKGEWTRGVEVTMQGPAFLSYMISDSIDCGGAHPDSGVMSIVYDLQTGRPVDWTHLLPASLTGTVALEAGEDGTQMVTLSAKRLWGLYWMTYQTAHAGDDACLTAIHDIGDAAPPAMMVWLAAKPGGLGLTFNVPHAILACGDEMVIPTATLHQEGATLALIEALEAARAQ